MRRRRGRSAHANHERWLVSYADFVTLLFAFFVVLYSSSQVDQRKAGKLALAIQVAFQELGIFQASNTKIPVSSTEPMPFNVVQAVENAERTAAMGRLVPPTKGILGGNENGDLAELRQHLEKVLAPEIARQEVALRQDADGLVISLREVGFFDSGSARWKAGSQPAFARLAALLKEQAYLIRIEGHTDNVPIHTSQFASNWELSAARSIEVVRTLIATLDFAPERLSVAGYGEFHPIASNATDVGRTLNRRVDIVVLQKLPQSSPLAEMPRTLPPGKPQARGPSVAGGGDAAPR